MARIKGTITYNNSTIGFTGTTHIPYAAVELFMVKNQCSDIKDIWNFFEPGLRRYPKKHFLVSDVDYGALTAREKDRYVPTPIVFNGSTMYVSNEFDNGNNPKNNNLQEFIDYIETRGFVVRLKNSPNNKLPMGVPWGNDRDCHYVRYDVDVLPNERIEGLAEYLEWELERIYYFAKHELKVDVEGERCSVILCKGNPVHKYKNTDGDIANMIYHHARKVGPALDRGKIAEILKRKSITLSVAGKYCHNANADRRGIIKIYYQNIRSRSWDGYKGNVAQTLAHECFHLFHDQMSPIFYENTSVATIVEESLADFFSVLFLTNYMNNESYFSCAALERYNWWDEYFGSAIPYVYAYLFCSKNNLNPLDNILYYNEAKFRSVLFSSMSDMNIAYKELME